MKGKMSENVLSVFAACLSIGLFLIAWQLGTSLTQLGTLIPGPVEVVAAIGEEMCIRDRFHPGHIQDIIDEIQKLTAGQIDLCQVLRCFFRIPCMFSRQLA